MRLSLWWLSVFKNKTKIACFSGWCCSGLIGYGPSAAWHTSKRFLMNTHGGLFYEMGRCREIMDLSASGIIDMEWKIQKCRDIMAVVFQSRRDVGHLQHGILLRGGWKMHTVTGSTRWDVTMKWCTCLRRVILHRVENTKLVCS